jgi:hypothetical protein
LRICKVFSPHQEELCIDRHNSTRVSSA